MEWGIKMQIEDVPLAGFVKINSKDALLVIDMQNDFLPNGALPVAEGDKIIDSINELTYKFHQKENPIVFTQDWHPKDHQSFASAHPGKNAYDQFEAPGLGPVLWPDHCIQGTHGANFAPRIQSVVATLILRKGFHKHIDSYSAFLENDQSTETGLRTYLEAIGMNRVFLCGLALDYCVYYSAIDAKNFDFDVVFVLDLTKPVNSPENSVSVALQRMIDHKISFVTSDQILD